MDLERLYKNFEVMPDWQERYRFIIEMGKKIEQVPVDKQIDENKVQGCMSTVHMIISEDDQNDRVHFVASSDALIVNGLIAVLHVVYDDKTPQEITAINIEEVFSRLGLDKHISPNRRNGFFSMVERLKNLSLKEA